MNERELVYGGHTHCIKMNEDLFEYTYDGYVPERQRGVWRTYDGNPIFFVSNEASIMIDGLTDYLAYDESFNRIEVLNIERFDLPLENYYEYVFFQEVEDGTYEAFYKGSMDKPLAKFRGASSGSVVSGDGIFFITWDTQVIFKIDPNLNKVWEYSFNSENSISSGKSIFVFEGRVLANVGGSGNSKIISLSSSSGEVVWELDFDCIVDNFNLIGSRVYISSKKDHQWKVVSAVDGTVLLEGEIEYPNPDGFNELGGLWGNGEFLFLRIQHDTLRVTNEATGETIQDVKIPGEFTISTASYPISRGNYIYLGLESGGGVEKFTAYGGVLIISIDELKEGAPYSIIVEDKGAVSHNAVADGKTEHYEIDVSYEELGDVLRFGQIEIKLVAQRYSYNHWGNLDDDWKTRINKKFDGKIVLNIDKAKLLNPNEQKFDLMVELFNDHFKKKFRAPANKRPLELSWKYK
jgi:hypothetical protein